MSKLTSPDVSLHHVESAQLLPPTARAIGEVACITLGREVNLSQLLDGTIPFTAETIIYDRSGVEIDAAELLFHIEREV